MRPEPAAVPFEKDPDFPLFRSLLPFVERFEEAMWDRSPYAACFTGEARAQISLGLLQRLARVSKYALLSMRNWRLFGNLSPTPQDREQAARELCTWLVEKGGWQDRLDSQPVWKRYIDAITGDYQVFIREFCARFSRDRAEIGEVFFGGAAPERITGMEARGDPHAGGRCVIVLELDGPGKKLVYKPRDVSAEECYRRLVERWFADITYAPRVLAGRQDPENSAYGYAEFIENRPVKTRREIGTFFENVGGLLALGYFLGSRDLHRENIIAMDSRPVLVDAEMLMSPGPGETDPGRFRHGGSLERAVQDSVLSIQILPTVNLEMEGEKTIAVSPLYSREAGQGNLPVCRGRRYAATGYEDRIRRGFRATYRKILENREALREEFRALSACRFRCVIRGTPVYARLFMHCLSSDLLADSDRFQAELDRLDDLFRRDGDRQQELLGISRAEKADMLRGDIPLFHTCGDSRDLFDHGGRRVCRDFFLSSCMENSLHVFRRAGEEDLAFQEKLIEQTLEPIPLKNITFDELVTLADPYWKIARESFGSAAPDTGEMLREAEDIFLEYDRRLLREPSGRDGGWLTRTAFSDGYSLVRPLGPTLYEGEAGLAVFFAALSTLSGSDRIAHRSRELSGLCVEHARRQLEDFRRHGVPGTCSYGYAAGLSGLISGLLVLSGFLQDPAIRDLALSFFSLLREERIGEWGEAEQIGGIAGLAAVITGFDVLKDSERGRILMQACRRRLLQMKTMPGREGVRLWKTRDDRTVLSGFGHGQAGIGFALSRLAEALQDPETASAARDAFRFEHAVFDEEHGNWPNLRPGHEWPFLFGLCYGAPGIGMAALQCRHAFPFLEEEVRRAVRFCRELYRMIPADHLCCGNCSVIDFLLEEGGAESREAAMRYMAAVMRKKERLGTYIGIQPERTGGYRASLFHGSAGVGYTLLRCLQPDRFRTMAF